LLASTNPQQQSVANTPTAYYPMHSFDGTGSNADIDPSTTLVGGRTSRIRFSMDTDSQYLLDQVPSSSTTSTSHHDAILQQQQQQKSGTMKRVKI